MTSLARRLIITVAIAAFLPAAVSASVVFGTGNPGNQNTDNVLFNPCVSITTTGTTVNGCFSTSHTTYIDFTSNEILVVNGGQAKITAQDGSFDNLTIQMHDPTLGFTKIIFDIDTDSADPTGDMDVLVTLFGGATASQTYTGLGNGQNFFSVVSNGTDVIQSLHFESTSAITSVLFEDAEQIRIGLATGPDGQCPAGYTGSPPDCISPTGDPTSVPEPATIALLGLSLAGLAASRRRKLN